MHPSDKVVFVQHALDLLPGLFGSIGFQKDEITRVWDELSDRAKDLIPLGAQESLTEFSVVHHRDCMPWESYSKGGSYSDSVVDGGTISAAVFYMEWWISICAAYQAGDHGDSYVRQAVLDFAGQHGIDAAIGYVERVWSNRFIAESYSAFNVLWTLIRAQAYGIDPALSSEELLAARRQAGRDASTPHVIPSLLAEMNRKQGRNHKALLEIYQKHIGSLEQQLKEIKKASASSSAWLSGIRILQPQYKVLQKIAEEAFYTVTFPAEQDEIDTLARYADERHADITTCLFSAHPVGLSHLTPQTARSIEFYYGGRVMFPDSTRQLALSMLSSTGTLDRDELDRCFEASLSEGHRWVGSILRRRLHNFLEEFRSSIQEKREGEEKTRERAVSILLSMGTQQEQESFQNVLNTILRLGITRSPASPADYLELITHGIMAAHTGGNQLAIGALPFVLWSTGGRLAQLNPTIVLPHPVTSNAVGVASIRSGARLRTRNGSQIAVELQQLIAARDQRVGAADNVKGAMDVLIAELLNDSKRPYVIWQAWGTVFEGCRTDLALARNLAVVSFFLLPEVFSERDLQQFGWFELEAMLIAEKTH